MNLPNTRRARAARTALVLAGPALAAAVALAVPIASSAQTASAPVGTTAVTSNPNNYDCSGHVQPGKKEPGNPDPQTQYYFSCDGPITGYSLVIAPSQTQQITNFDASPVVQTTSGPVLSDSFSCVGSFPSNGVNCTGNYAGNFTLPELVSGQFSTSLYPCTNPRIDPQLIVDEATVAAGVVTQSIAGPFDLGAPKYCPSRFNAKPKAKAKKSAAAK